MRSLKLNQKKSSSIFLDIFLPFFLCILITLTVLSYVLYLNFENIALKKVYDFQKNDLQSISHNLSKMIDSAKALSVGAFFDSDMYNLLYYEDWEPNIYLKAQLRLESYKNSNPFLHSIYVYNGSHMFIAPSTHYEYSKDTIPDEDIMDILSNMKKYPSQSLIPRQIKTDIANDKTPKYVYSFLFYDSQMQSGKISEAIVLNISENWLRSSIDALKKSSSNRIFIINGDGSLVISDTKYPMLKDLSSADYIKKIGNMTDTSDFFRADVDGVDSLVAYVKTKISDYTFISVTPYNEIVGEIQNMKKVTYLIVIVITLIVVFIMLFLTKRLYNPINSIVQKLNTLESENKGNFFNRKQEYLKSIIKGASSLNSRDFDKSYEEFNIKLRPTEEMLMLILKLDNYSLFCDSYSLNDRSLMKFSVMNISSELCAQIFENECIDMGDDHIVLILNVNSSDSQLGTTLVQIVQTMQENIQKYLKISVSATISEAYADIRLINSIYNSTLEASYCRIVAGHKCIIFAKETKQLPSNDFKYPLDKEKQIWECLKLGHSNDAKKLLTEIFGIASTFGFTSLNMTILHFLISLNNILETLKVSDSFATDNNFITLPNKINKLETLDEIKEIFFDIFDRLCTQSDQNTDIKHQKLIDTVIELIDKEYFRHDLSLDSISERLGISPSYLSRLFKKYKTFSMVDYVNKVRLEKAKELLTTTDYQVNDIMEKTGFTSRSHFYTLFKKTYGFSPGSMKFSNKIDNIKD